MIDSAVSWNLERALDGRPMAANQPRLTSEYPVRQHVSHAHCENLCYPWRIRALGNPGCPGTGIEDSPWKWDETVRPFRETPAKPLVSASAFATKFETLQRRRRTPVRHRPPGRRAGSTGRHPGAPRSDQPGLGENVREYPNLNKPFLDSIAERGVVVPLTAIRHHDGAVEVRDGQRRTMAARKLRLSTVPVYLLPATAADTAAETIDRIVHQMVTNDHKCDLTDAQRAGGIQQMIDAGLSVT